MVYAFLPSEFQNVFYPSVSDWVPISSLKPLKKTSLKLFKALLFSGLASRPFQAVSISLLEILSSDLAYISLLAAILWQQSCRLSHLITLFQHCVACQSLPKKCPLREKYI